MLMHENGGQGPARSQVKSAKQAALISEELCLCRGSLGRGSCE